MQIPFDSISFTAPSSCESEHWFPTRCCAPTPTQGRHRCIQTPSLPPTCLQESLEELIAELTGQSVTQEKIATLCSKIDSLAEGFEQNGLPDDVENLVQVVGRLSRVVGSLAPQTIAKRQRKLLTPTFPVTCGRTLTPRLPEDLQSCKNKDEFIAQTTRRTLFS